MSTIDSLRSTAVALAANAQALARAPDAASAALERSAAWFNEPVAEGSHLLRAPAGSAAAADPQVLTERFLSCLCER